MDREKLDRFMIQAIRNNQGIVDARPLKDEDRPVLLEFEVEAEKRSLMGLGKVINSGVADVLDCQALYAAITNMDFDWGRDPTLVLIKDGEIVGQEVRDEETLKKFAARQDVWFMHKNFIVYKDKIKFPQDVMKKICHFEVPGIPARWCLVQESGLPIEAVIYANPCVLADVYLKNEYFEGLDVHQFGSIVVGVKLAP